MPTRDVPKVIPVAAKVGFAWIVLFFSILGWFGVGAFLGNDLKSTLREIPILQFGFVTAVVSTVCGWLAVHKIRKSRGKLGGLGLALFDGLVFPLLILDALLAFLIIVAVPGARDTLMDSFQVGFGGPRTGPVLAELASIAAVLLVVDFLVVRAVWRAMNRHIRSGAGSNLNTPGRPAQAGAAAWGIATAGAVLLLLAAWGSWTRKAAEAKGQWQPQEVKWIPVPAQGALARICITNVLRYGRIAIFELVSEAGFPEHMITVRYEGPGLESYPPAYTELALTGLLIPWPVGADATNTPVFTGRNIGRGPGTFRFGFALPNEHAAELVVNQARGLYLGKTNHLGEAANVLLLFQLTRPAPEAGDGRGKWQVLTGTLSVSAVPAWESTATFGPVIERVVVPKMALDLDTGKAATYEPQWRWVHDPVSSRRSRVPLQPMRSQGLDIWLDEDWALLSADTGLRAMSNEDWDAISPSQLIKTLELINRGGSDPTELRVGTNGPVTCGFQTREGGQGLLQLAGFTENPRGVKMRYKLVQTKPAASTGSGKPEGSQRKFVRLVVDNAAMTFEGQPTTWDAVGALLEKVPERKNTVLEFAVTSD